MTVRTVSPFLALLLVGLGLARPTSAQGDPVREIKEIARAIDEQLQEIDRLLLESGKKGQPRQKPKELLQQADAKSQSVEQGIDTLIEKLQQMKNQGGGGGGQPHEQNQDQSQQDQSGQGQPRPQPGQGQRNRNENKTPDIAERPQNGNQPDGQPQGQPGQPGQQGQQGQQPGQQQPLGPDGKPLGGQESHDGGRNTTGNRQPEPELGPGNPGQGEGSWGELQPYMNFLKNRGSTPPQIPEKFRKYYEAWLKQNAGSPGAAGTGTPAGGGRR
jgi:hypothetical protein